MKVIHVNQSDSIGGAARAAYRIHCSLLNAGIKSSMRVLEKKSDDPSVVGGSVSNGLIAMHHFAHRIARRATRYLRRPRTGFFSTAGISSGLGRELDSSVCDILHLHWITGGTLSIEEVGALSKPVVWTLHDMWAFCGAEHYVEDVPESRFRLGYRRSNAPPEERKSDLNRRTWERKKKKWNRPAHIVCPSAWLAKCVAESELLKNWPVRVIPYPIDLAVWKPVPKQIARDLLGLPRVAKVVLMGAFGGLADPRKGGDLAIDALRALQGTDSRPDQLLIFGQSAAAAGSLASFPVTPRFLGPIHDDLTMTIAYSAADVMLVPSRQDNLPNTAIEALACGTPVVGFEIGGIPEIIRHKRTGWLAKPFSIDDLAAGISWTLSKDVIDSGIAQKCRDDAVSKFAPEKSASAYSALYTEISRTRRPSQ